MPTGRQRFYTKSRANGSSSLTDDRNAVLQKDWFYGAYTAEADKDWPSDTDDFQGYEGLGTDSTDSTGWTRQLASGRSDSPNSYWWQHDYFVHDGYGAPGATLESGQWLRGAWYTAANGGFDGRWAAIRRPTGA